FPRVIIPAAAVGAGLVDFVISFFMLLALMLYYRIMPGVNFLLLPILLALTALLAVAIGMCLSALNVRYRDVKYAIPFLSQVWMYVSPVAYPSSIVPQRWRWLYILNPFAGIIEGYRSAFFNRPFDWPALGIAVVITFILLFLGSRIFSNMERSFADII